MSLYEDRFRQAGNYSLPTSNIKYEFETPYMQELANKFNSNNDYYYSPEWEIYRNNDDAKNQSMFNLSNLIAPVGAGIAAATQTPGTYYVQANWKGNGLANTGLGYTKNLNYANPYDVGQMLSSLANLKGWSLTKNNLFNTRNNNQSGRGNLQTKITYDRPSW